MSPPSENGAELLTTIVHESRPFHRLPLWQPSNTPPPPLPNPTRQSAESQQRSTAKSVRFHNSIAVETQTFRYPFCRAGVSRSEIHESLKNSLTPPGFFSKKRYGKLFMWLKWCHKNYLGLFRRIQKVWFSLVAVGYLHLCDGLDWNLCCVSPREDTSTKLIEL